MARRARHGQVIRRKTKGGVVWAIRFRAYGARHYVTLGKSRDGWTRQLAEEQLANVCADVRRGIWRPPEPEPAPHEPEPEQTFHVFASEWFARRSAEGLRPRTLEYLRWALSSHLLPHFAHMRLSAITVPEIDRYAHAKIAEGRLSNRSVNKTLEVLSAVMELAVEYELVPRNPARGRRRRLPASRPARAHLEPHQVSALLEAAAELDSEDRGGRRYRRALLATLAFAGLRIGELLGLRWRDVDLANGWLHIRESKTDAGVRRVDIQRELRDELAELKARARFVAPSDFVFPTGTGRAGNRNNVRRRVLLRAVERANQQVSTEGAGDPLPERLSPHALRRTFASWLVAEGEDIAYVMGQLGHTDPKMTLGLYAKALKSKRRRSQADRTRASDGRQEAERQGFGQVGAPRSAEPDSRGPG